MLSLPTPVTFVPIDGGGATVFLPTGLPVEILDTTDAALVRTPGREWSVSCDVADRLYAILMRRALNVMHDDISYDIEDDDDDE